MAAGASIGAAFASSGPARSAVEAPRSAGLPPRAEFLIRGAHVLTMDPQLGELPIGDVHVVNGKIAAVGANLDAPGAEALSGANMIAMPGLIETHWHMWGTVARNMAGDDPSTGYFPYSRILGDIFTPEDNARGVRLALAEALNGGITTVHNWSHNLLAPSYADAELQAHRDFGGRALFSYGYSRLTQRNQTLPLEDVARVQKQWIPQLDGLVTLGIASYGPQNNSIEICRKEWGFARRHGIRITCHMGTSRASFEKKHGVRALNDAGLLGPDLLVVHNTYTDAQDLASIARTGTFLSFSPFTELRTGFGITPILPTLAAGVKVSLSVDTPILCGSADMFAIMKAIQNIGDGSKPSEFALPARRALEMGTIDGARALGLDHVTGSLTPGKRADLILLRTRDINMAPLTDPVRMVVQSAQPSNVELVMVDGRILKRNGRLVSVDIDSIVDNAKETVERIQAEVKKRGITSKDVEKQLPFSATGE
jgi:5-methylthioadenosine/S-adenosylhomocysteine deaminase